MSLQSNTAAPPGVSAGRATIKQINGTDPAAAAEFSETVPSTGGVVAWELLAVSVELVTDATGAVWPSLIIDDGTDIIFRGLSGTAGQALSTTCRHTWAPGLELAGAASDLAKTGGLPEGLVLPSGYRIRSLTNALAGTDNYGAPSLFVVEYSN